VAQAEGGGVREVEMPFPRNWVEELAFEWLAIEGYIAESNMRLKAAKKGGVFEADVVGVKLQNEALDIVHVETGSLSGKLEDNFTRITRKFVAANQIDLSNIIDEKVEWNDDVSYTPLYIASYLAKKQYPVLKRKLYEYSHCQGYRKAIDLLLLEDFIVQKLLPSVDRWKRNERESGRRVTEKTTLPEPYWLSNLLDFMAQRKLIVGQ
jgi:hypothetical protein